MALITFDMMQKLPVPTFTHNSMFYLRQMWVYNLGIHVGLRRLGGHNFEHNKLYWA